MHLPFAFAFDAKNARPDRYFPHLYATRYNPIPMRMCALLHQKHVMTVVNPAGATFDVLQLVAIVVGPNDQDGLSLFLVDTCYIVVVG
ncbi:hypothetical protein SeMB42_g02035 [Synchytrium endobioticum]|uniref:Uncharacterized protein n=1 Tax=Synchytrium endobioticum TaxID=286115 RepID=A0A507DJE5_9FUNG|nr:hypothetical protein SeMB42_g02035 [Synchytrium endobioticum]